MPDQSRLSGDASVPAKSGTDAESDRADIPRTASPQRLILMGTGPFAVPSFDALRLAGHEIMLVVTKPQRDNAKSRKGPPPSPVRIWAERWNRPIFDPLSINEQDAVTRLLKERADLLVVCDYGQILKPAALESATMGGINLHGSLLPKYRGAAPVQWALLSGDAVTGVTVIHMTPRLDGGPIVATRETEIRDDETAGQLEDRLALLGVDATLEAVSALIRWDGQSSIGVAQDPVLVTKAPRLKKSDAEIDWGRTAREIDCHVRGMQPWPVAYTHYRASDSKPPMRLAIKEVKILEQPSDDFACGEILAEDGLRVATADRFIEIKRLQPSGKREMTAIEFVRGHRPAQRSRLFAT